MKKGDLSSKRRPYDNTLRREQARRTRERILEAAVEVLAGSDGGDVTLAMVARRAGVSEPTLYRHFGSRERLYEEIEAHVQAKLLRLPVIPKEASALPEGVRRLFERFGAEPELLGVATRSELGRTVRERGWKRRARWMRELVASHAPHLDEAALDRAAGVLRVLIGYQAYETLTRELGLSASDAGEAVAWAAETLLAALGEGEGVAGDGRRGREAAGSRAPGAGGAG